ncbi:Transcription antitermination protein NusB [Austwickia sp. TVS 96-490-7B]|uniref:transcription antitermination factor NusB n=1 Tax=Austwickia sp. TVS 96-490-7B TaxID=2830843 RepID=UPI001C55E9A9|nr:transcription antitermination factor NusB [Austwickia sp. TVS 96-490-7B]MBW3086016.1 Transcription antitermination protein NusB [Austwickia sp. TVS 96-490-7B]
MSTSSGPHEETSGARGAAARGRGGREPLSGARTKARRAALDLLFEAEQRGLNARTLLAERTARPVDDKRLRPYTVTLVEGVIHRWRVIEEALGTYSQGWPVSRMPAVDRAILRVGAWEILFNDDVPDAVATQQAVELATALSTDESPNFVNGLLSRLSEVKDTIDRS